jgi:uncharacterized protein (TIGR02271 family)
METNSTANITDEKLASEIHTENETIVIPVIEEEAFLGKQVVETGKVLISKRVNEREEIVDVPLFSEQVTVERVPVNRYVDVAPVVRHEGDTMIIPVVQEQLVMQKRLVLVEELRVKKQIVETHQPQSVTLRKEEVEVKRVVEDKNSAAS